MISDSGSSGDAQSTDRLSPEALGWAALLAQWMTFAKANATPIDSGDVDERLARSVTSVITLQAVTHALGDLARTHVDERAFARDRSEVLVREHAGKLDDIWRGEMMPEALLEVEAAARVALTRAPYADARMLVWTGGAEEGAPGEMWVMPETPDPGPSSSHVDQRGTLLVMQPGTVAMPGEVVAWWSERTLDDGHEFDAWLAQVRTADGIEERTADVPPQIYRQINDDGQITGDVVTPVWHEPSPGLPLLVPILALGEEVGQFTVDADEWEMRQRAAMGDDGVIEVRDITS